MTSKRTKMLKKSLPAGRPLTFEEWQEEILRCEGVAKPETQKSRSIPAKIDERLNMLDRMMRDNSHLENAQPVEDQLKSISKFWSSLSDGDRDYLNAVRHALTESIPWNSQQH